MQEFILYDYSVIGSTNDEAKSLLSQGASEGTVVRAESQTAGRGRRGRKWVSEPGNLYFSVILCPKCLLTTASQLSFVIALAVGKAILPYLTNPEILAYKWPNDLLLQKEKVAGILIETESAGGQLAEACVIGIGLNLISIPEHPAYRVTALKNHTKTNLSRDILFSQLLDQIKSVYQIWQRDGFTPIREAWMERAYGLGENLTVNLGKNDICGEFLGLSDEGAFLLKDNNGVVHCLVSVEI
ncbi:MAG: biotin--[acetyl-CoA-carboxylase] ligase [Alphaproteobacteria bacterium]|nr:biotin--[acetyl-CoA-carboxylase] ligase [Alphaproteobacteria bacterium]